MQPPAQDARASAAGVRIELHPPLMDRGRSISRGRGAKKRATLPSHSASHSSHSHSHHPPLSFSDSASPSTPEPSVEPQVPRMPHTAPQRGGKARQSSITTATTPHRASSPAADQAMRVAARTDRPARSATFHSSSFSFEPPSAAAGSIMAAAPGPSRKRSRTFEMAPYDGAADDEAHSKGGHSLRKRARIDYTQEMIDDDLGVPAPKHELVVKAASTPSARGRKRKGAHDESGDESDDFTSNPKRHRIGGSPAPGRLAPSRRRNPSKKLPTDASPYVDQASDNEVQDTILVSVPSSMAPGAPAEDSDQQSSFGEAESQSSSSSDESDAVPAPAQPPTPQVQPSASIKDSVSVAPEDEVIDRDFIPEQPDEKSHPPAQISLATHPETERFEQSPELEGQKSALVVPTTTTLGHPEPQLSKPEQGANEHSLVQQQQQNTTSQEPPALEPVVEKPEPETFVAPKAEAIDEPAIFVPQTAEDAAHLLSALHEPPSLTAKPTGPSRFAQLERIHKSETPFASHLRLTPYEEDDVTLPGPYTEWVYPADPAKPESTPIPTPPPAASSASMKLLEVDWNPSRRLKTSEFFVLYRKETKRRQQKGLPPVSMIEFNNECVRLYKAAHAGEAVLTTPLSTTEPTAGSVVVAEGPEEEPSTTTEPGAPQDPQTVESRLPTAAPSPTPAEDAADQDDAIEDEQEAEDAAVDIQARPNGPVEPIEVTRNPHKQYLFPKIRDPNEFIEAFEGWQDFTTEHLYEVVAAAVEVLDVYQQEYNELKKYLDDEENAKRRQANDKTIVNWENRQKADEPLPWRRHFDDLVKGPPAFEVRGVRAPKPYIDDPSLEHQKEEDRIMAQAYGFKLNTHPTQVGRQNPEEQRWEMPENRLRKRTEKGAELAEENVVEGKRVRKPRYVSDQSKDPSRAGTPTGIVAYGPARRQRRKLAAAAANGDEPEGLEQAQFAESFTESPRKGRPARYRGPVLADDAEQIMPVVDADNDQTEDEEVEVSDKPKVRRRRGRGAALPSEPPTSVPTSFGGELNKPRRARGGRGQPTGLEIASSSFYSNASTAATQPDSRPSTASSDGTARTAETAESTYSLRDKRKRNFALENDPELESRPQRRRVGAAQKQQGGAEPPKKRGPRKKEVTATQAPPPVESVPSPVMRPASPPPLQQPVATRFYNNFVTGAGMLDVGGGPHAVVPTTHAAGPFMHTFNAAPAFPPGAPPPPPPPPAVKKPITKIKFTNNGAASQAISRATTPANGAPGSSGGGGKAGGKGSRGGNNKGGNNNNHNAASEAKASAAAASANGSGNGNGNGNGSDLDKPYAEMTKSEKMSWSMRRRWASGEMQGAVEKRRTTLANKKAEKAATTPGAGPSGVDTISFGHMGADPGSAGPSGPTTPVSMHGGLAGPPHPPPGLGPGPLALPPGPPPMLLQPVQPLQGYLQQPGPYSYQLGPPGPPGPMQ